MHGTVLARYIDFKHILPIIVVRSEKREFYIEREWINRTYICAATMIIMTEKKTEAAAAAP